MADRRSYRSEPELARALAELGEHLDYPPTPDVASAVRRRLEQAPPLRSPWQRSRVWRIALGVAAALLVIFAALALFPAMRTALADRLGLPGITITHLPAVPTATSTPTPLPTPLPTPTSIPVGIRLGLGQPVPLEQAQAGVSFPISTPTLSTLGPPDEVYLGSSSTRGSVTLVYRPRPGLPEDGTTGVGLLLTELPGSIDGGLLGKGLGPDTRLESAVVSGHLGYWIEGAPHLFFYQDARGNIQQETLRLASNTLLWERGGLTLRIESALGRDAAIAIAGSIR